jgi:sucrose phosphorylase
LSEEDISEGLKTPIVKNQLKIMRLRNTSKAFLGEVNINDSEENILDITWSSKNEFAQLKVDLTKYSFSIHYSEEGACKQIKF